MNTTPTTIAPPAHRNGSLRGDIPLDLLSRVRIATPCPAKWEDMTGDDRVRHCALCNLSVHNLSAMTRAEAESLLLGRFDADGTPTGERLCAQIARRADGTIITRDCPVGIARARERMRRAAARVAAAIGLLAVAHGAIAWAERRVRMAPAPVKLATIEPLAAVARWLRPASAPPAAVPGGINVMGTFGAVRGRTTAIRGDVLVKGEVYVPPKTPPAPAQPTGGEDQAPCFPPSGGGR